MYPSRNRISYSPHSSAISPSDTEESLIKRFGMYTCLIWLTVLSILVNSLIFIMLSWFRIEPMWISEYCWIAWYSLLGQIPYSSICWDNWFPCHGIREAQIGLGFESLRLQLFAVFRYASPFCIPFCSIYRYFYLHMEDTIVREGGCWIDIVPDFGCEM